MKEHLDFIRRFLLHGGDDKEYTQLVYSLDCIVREDLRSNILCFDIRLLTRDLLAFPQEDYILKLIISKIDEVRKEML